MNIPTTTDISCDKCGSRKKKSQWRCKKCFLKRAAKLEMFMSVFNSEETLFKRIGDSEGDFFQGKLKEEFLDIPAGKIIAITFDDDKFFCQSIDPEDYPDWRDHLWWKDEKTHPKFEIKMKIKIKKVQVEQECKE